MPKKVYKIYNRPVYSIGEPVQYVDEQVEVMTTAGNYAMVRKPKAMPFVVQLKELKEMI